MSAEGNEEPQRNGMRFGVACSCVHHHRIAVAQAKQHNPLHLSCNHVTASVSNLEREAAWYERVLGFHRSKLLGAAGRISACTR